MLSVCCPTCSAFQPSAEQEREIRRSERALVVGAARAHVADARAAMKRAQAALSKPERVKDARADLERCIARLDALLGDDEPVERRKPKAA